MNFTASEIDRIGIDTLRLLAIDAVDKARSGHPGLPLGAAPLVYTIWDRFLRYDPCNPSWFDRDRFVLSAGHGSALLYSLLHLAGFDLSMDDLQNFRQWGSKTPGHPEFGETPGVEATTGPLGQGFSMGVGMAVAEKFLAARFNRDGFALIDHYTYALVSDGDLMEGVAAEAASLAGHLGLGKLIYVYDSNDITIEGSTQLAFTEDVGKRFEAYHWHVQHVADGNDIAAIAAALAIAKDEKQRPSLIVVKTHIGYGSPMQDNAEVHGSPLGKEANRKTRAALGYPDAPPFYVPDIVREHFAQKKQHGGEAHRSWQELWGNYRRVHPDAAQELQNAMNGELPQGWDSALPTFTVSSKGTATRSASGKIINALAAKVPHFLGGSADLAPSTKTLIDGAGDFSAQNPSGRNIHFGIREHAMAAIVNGMALHGGVRPYGATFLVFSDYMRPALRLAAMMRTRVIFVFTHDSIGLGEDGPTHQPVEHLLTLRAIPGLTVLRPADANETSEAWRLAMSMSGPVALALTRQNVPELDVACYPVRAGVARGAYVLSDAPQARIVLLATGSEVHLVLQAQRALQEKGIAARVVSMPSWEVFAAQDISYRREVLPEAIPTLAVEAASSLGWDKYADDVVGIDRFGASAPWEIIYAKLGLRCENIVAKAMALLEE